MLNAMLLSISASINQLGSIMETAVIMKVLQEEPECSINEIAIEELSTKCGADAEDLVRDPDVLDLQAFVSIPVCWGDSYLENKMKTSESVTQPDSVSPVDPKYAFSFESLLSATKHMMRVAQCKHFDASIGKTHTNWF